MNRIALAAVASLVVLAALLLVLFRAPAPLMDSQPPATNTPAMPLLVYCAASNRSALELVRADFQKETGIVVEVQYGPSQGLLSSLEVSHTGDLYIPADDSYIVLARDKGLLTEETPLAGMQVVIAVREGNPHQISSVADLLRPEVRLSQANPDLAAVGRLSKEALTKQGTWEKLAERTQVFRINVNEATNDVAAGAADAAISYDVVVRGMPGLAAVSAPELEGLQAQVVVGLLKSSAQPEVAKRFVSFLTGPAGRARYSELGFQLPTAGEGNRP